MKNNTRERGQALVSVLCLIIFLLALLSLGLMRYQAGLQLAKNRFLQNTALDLAEDGVEYERYMLAAAAPGRPGAPHRLEIGTFAGCPGSFEAFVRPGPGGAPEIVSEGKLISPAGKTVSRRIVARAGRGRAGFQIVAWSEE